MIHYTLNTGHARRSPRSEVADDAARKMRPLTRTGEHALPIAGYRLVVPNTKHGLAFTVYRGDAPLATCGVARDEAGADEIWPGLESLYLSITDSGPHAGAGFEAPRRPANPPWLAEEQ